MSRKTSPYRKNSLGFFALGTSSAKSRVANPGKKEASTQSANKTPQNRASISKTFQKVLLLSARHFQCILLRCNGDEDGSE